MAHRSLHRQELTRICQFWREANILTELTVPIKPPISIQRLQRGLGVHVGRIAAVLACFVPGWWGLQLADNKADITVATGVIDRGEPELQRTLSIGDSQRATVAVGGRLRIGDLERIPGSQRHR